MIGKLIRNVIAKRGIGGKLPLQTIQQAYLRVVDASLARRTRVSGLRGGTVTVEADSAALAYELHGFTGADLLKRLKAEPGTGFVKKLRFVVGAGPND